MNAHRYIDNIVNICPIQCPVSGVNSFFFVSSRTSAGDDLRSALVDALKEVVKMDKKLRASEM